MNPNASFRVPLYQLPSGRWRAIVQFGGQKRTASADTKPEARRLEAQLLNDMGGAVGRRGLTVGELLAAAVTERHAAWSPTYADDVDRVIARLPDAFADRLARDVTPSIINALYRQCGWLPHRMRRLHEVLSMAWTVGQRLELVTGNPVANVAKPPKPKRTLTIPTDVDVAAILAAARTDTERLALRIGATLGTRRGETVALRWVDVDVERAVIKVLHSLIYTPRRGIEQRDTKTGESGQRVVAIDLPTAAALRRLKASQAGLALAAGIVPRYVFSYDAGHTPWRPDRLTKIFALARIKAGVDGVRLHDLRHYVATSMLQDGDAPIDVANQLGHSTTATTLQVYAHYLPGRGRESVDRRAARLDG